MHTTLLDSDQILIATSIFSTSINFQLIEKYAIF